MLWPGGTRNRLYLAHSGERLVVPEISCSFDVEWSDAETYRTCVRGALEDLREAGVISRSEEARLFASAWIAFVEEH